MKGYLFGLGAMLVGAGLMFVLMHGEVRAEGEKEIHCEEFHSKQSFSFNGIYKDYRYYNYCKIKDLICVSHVEGIRCVKN